MGSDISRSTFDPRKHYSGVRQQQGRVSVDADWNEQVDIASHRVSTETVDVIGPSGAPRDNAGFQVRQFQTPTLGWVASAFYAQGTAIVDSNGNIEVAVTSGTSSAGPPSWPKTVGDTVTESTGLTWQLVQGDLSISPGRMYVDGLLCELNTMPVAIENFTGDGTAPAGTQVQVASVVMDGWSLKPGDWLQISAQGSAAPAPQQVQVAAVNSAADSLTFTTSISTWESQLHPQLQRTPTYATQPNYPSAPPLTGTGPSIVYLDVWERTVTALEDPEIQEIALGGADTATRTETIWQVKLADMSSVSNVGLSCATPDLSLSPWEQDTQPSGGQLTNGVLQSGAPSLCALTPNTGYTGLENQLYRVEIHQGGSPLSGPPTTIPTGTAYFKWSRDNGSIATSVTNISPSGSASQLTVLSTGRDDVLSFSPGNWVELIDDYLELSGQPGELHQIAVGGVDPTNSIITLQDAVSADFLARFSASNSNYHPRIVRWDQGGTDGSVYQSDSSGNMTVWMNLNSGVGNNGIPIPPAGTTLVLENGVTVSFSLNPDGGLFNVDDYWIFAARTADASVENLNQAPPRGIQHHYARLGIVNFGQTPWSTSDCRRIFPPLAEPAVHVTKVNLTGVGSLLNDGSINIQNLVSGINVTVDTPLDPSSVTQPNSSAASGGPQYTDQATCLVTIDSPTPIGGTIIGFTPLILPASVSLDSTQTVIGWSTTQTVVDAINNQFSASSQALLAHLTLKGDFIWSRDNPDVHLDGEVVGAPYPDSSNPNVQHAGLQLPSGDGRRGGDFQMWFWLTPAPTVTLSTTALFFPPTPVNTTSPAQQVTITNNTANPLTFAVAVQGQYAVDQASVTVPKGGTVTINVTFTPSQSGQVAGNLSFTSSSSGYTLPNVTMTGTGLSFAFSASPTALIFANVAPGSSASQPVTLTNTSNGVITISGITDQLSPNSPFTFNPTGTLAPGTTITVPLTFSPTAVGNFPDILTINSNAPAVAINVAASSVQPPLSVSPTSLGFNYDQSTGEGTLVKSVSVSNPSAVAITVTPTISGTSSGDFKITSPPCGTLSPGGECTITVEFVVPRASPSAILVGSGRAVVTMTATLQITNTGTPNVIPVSLTATLTTSQGGGGGGGGKNIPVGPAGPRIPIHEQVQQRITNLGGAPPGAQDRPAPASGTRSAFIRPEERSSPGSQPPQKEGEEPPNKKPE